MEFIDWLVGIFGCVVMTMGNHEYRWSRYIQDRLLPETLWAVRKDILQMMKTGVVPDERGNEISRYNWDNKVFYTGGEEPWWIKWGRALVVHPMKSANKSGTACATAIKFADDYFDHHGIDFDAAVFGHTHQVGSVYSKGRKLMEQGCLCIPLDYSKQGTGAYQPQQNGCAVLYQDKHGNTDFDKSRAIYLGIVTAVKDDNLSIGINKKN
jgi:hypothetical protein